MASTGYETPITPNIYGTVEENLNQGNFVGPNKLGVVNTFPNSVAAAAVRQARISFNLTTNTQASIAHGLVDQDGNPATPTSLEPLYSSSNAFYSSQVPDATNIYLTAPAGATTAVTGVMVVFY